MTQERIKSMIFSTVKEDVEIALFFLRAYPISEIKKILPGGTANRKGTRYSINLSCVLNPTAYKCSNRLYIHVYYKSISFTTEPIHFNYNNF